METQVAAPEGAAVVPFDRKLAALIDSDKKYKAFKADMEKEKATLDGLKVECLDEFERMGVSSMKSKGRTIFLARQFWAAAAEGAEKLKVIDELRELGLGDFVSFNTQSLSGYVRETAKQHPDLVDAKGDLIGTPEQIVAILPGNLPQLCKVTEKMELKIRKS